MTVATSGPDSEADLLREWTGPDAEVIDDPCLTVPRPVHRFTVAVRHAADFVAYRTCPVDEATHRHARADRRQRSAGVPGW
ncbi:MAG TPA: hypothetical protein VGN81_22815 [Pseudonocardiaceae bacterium]|jgi:hypothetical protein